MSLPSCSVLLSPLTNTGNGRTGRPGRRFGDDGLLSLRWFSWVRPLIQHLCPEAGTGEGTGTSSLGFSCWQLVQVRSAAERLPHVRPAPAAGSPGGRRAGFGRSAQSRPFPGEFALRGGEDLGKGESVNEAASGHPCVGVYRAGAEGGVAENTERAGSCSWVTWVRDAGGVETVHSIFGETGSTEAWTEIALGLSG